MLRASAWLLLGLMLTGCKADGAVTLSVDVVTDFAPGIEFAVVQVEVTGGESDELPATATAEDAASFLRGRRVLTSDVPRGVVELSVALLRIDRSVVATRRQRITVRGDTGTVVAISRICEGVTCPGAEDSSAATECAYGRCVPPECAPDDVEVCSPGGVGRPVYGCREDSECAVSSLASCARFRCLDSVCVVERDESPCGGGEYCDIYAGCTPLPGTPMDAGFPDAGGPDAAIEPAPVECRADGSRVPPDMPPGGTLICPDDKNLPGCPCPTPGATASCWPGLRINRDYGVCRDGTTRCGADGRWGSCEGFRLPDPAAELGDPACRCFSSGQWELDRISTCFYGAGATVWATSTMGGASPCPPRVAPPPVPSSPWSPNRLTVDCSGSFELCFTLKAGDFDAPAASDCQVGGSCVQAWIDAPGVAQELAPLPAWLGADTACAKQFRDSGGYAEMSVHGLSLACDELGSSVDPYVFNRVKYCPAGCTAGAPGCTGCSAGSGGSF